MFMFLNKDDSMSFEQYHASRFDKFMFTIDL